MSEALDFDPQAEAWNIYEADEGRAILRLRVIPLRFRLLEDSRVDIDLFTISAASSTTPEARGPPGTGQDPAAPRVPVDFTPVREPMNTYTVHGPHAATVGIRVTALQVYRVDGVYDSHGEPVYEIRHETNISKVPPGRKTRGGARA
ncbi:MAG: hypothetical protein ACLGIK_06425 [Gemmatimonadota bacterium]